MKKIISLILAMLCFMCIVLPGTAMADAAFGGDYNYQDADFYVVVDAWDGYVNFRSGPGLEYGIINPIYNGEQLHISRTANNYYDEFTWGQINWGGQYGWVSLHECTEIPDPNSAPIEPTPVPDVPSIDPPALPDTPQETAIILDYEKLKSGEWQESFEPVVTILKEMLEKAYAPYSDFLTGAVIIDKDGRAFRGCFVENANSDLSIHAEAAAVANAVSAGSKDYKLIAVIGKENGKTETEDYTPCKDCLEILKEFVNSGDFYVLTVKLDADGNVAAFNVNTLGKVIKEAK